MKHPSAKTERVTIKRNLLRMQPASGSFFFLTRIGPSINDVHDERLNVHPTGTVTTAQTGFWSSLGIHYGRVGTTHRSLNVHLFPPFAPPLRCVSRVLDVLSNAAVLGILVA